MGNAAEYKRKEELKSVQMDKHALRSMVDLGVRVRHWVQSNLFEGSGISSSRQCAVRTAHLQAQAEAAVASLIAVVVADLRGVAVDPVASVRRQQARQHRLAEVAHIRLVQRVPARAHTQPPLLSHLPCPQPPGELSPM